MRIKLDPERVANLSDAEYEILAGGLERLNLARSDADSPGDVYVATFKLLRKVGARVNSFYDMRWIAYIFTHRRALIENLRHFQ